MAMYNPVEITDLSFIENECKVRPLMVLCHSYFCAPCLKMMNDWFTVAQNTKCIRMARIDAWNPKFSAFAGACGVNGTPAFIQFPLGYKLGDAMKPRPGLVPRTSQEIERAVQQFSESLDGEKASIEEADPGPEMNAKPEAEVLLGAVQIHRAEDNHAQPPSVTPVSSESHGHEETAPRKPQLRIPTRMFPNLTKALKAHHFERDHLLNKALKTFFL